MAIEYLGLSAINGPMVVLEGVQNAAYDEIVEMTVDGSKRNSAVSSRLTKIRQSFRFLREPTVSDSKTFTPA